MIAAESQEPVRSATGISERAEKESPLCPRCGFCMALCPMRLPVREIAALAEAGYLVEAAGHRTGECLSCGSCSRICPAGRDLAAAGGKVKEVVTGEGVAL